MSEELHTHRFATTHATGLKWTMYVMISILSFAMNPTQDASGATTLDAKISRQDRAKLIHLNAKNVYNHYCVHCHGYEGKGDGRSFAYEFEPKPTNFTDEEYMAELDDATISQVIIEGAASLDKSNLCPAWAETFSEKTVKELVAYVKAFATPPSDEEEEPGEGAAAAPEETEEETMDATPFIVWPILTLLSAFFICIAIFEWQGRNFS